MRAPRPGPRRFPVARPGPAGARLSAAALPFAAGRCHRSRLRLRGLVVVVAVVDAQQACEPPPRRDDWGDWRLLGEAE